jgi:hypothetical protein
MVGGAIGYTANFNDGRLGDNFLWDPAYLASLTGPGQIQGISAVWAGGDGDKPVSTPNFIDLQLGWTNTLDGKVIKNSDSAVADLFNVYTHAAFTVIDDATAWTLAPVYTRDTIRYTELPGWVTGVNGAGACLIDARWKASLIETDYSGYATWPLNSLQNGTTSYASTDGHYMIKAVGTAQLTPATEPDWSTFAIDVDVVLTGGVTATVFNENLSRAPSYIQITRETAP